MMESVNEDGTLAVRESRISSPARRVHERTAGDEALERVAFILDDFIRIPGTNWRVGLDSVPGLVVPGVGDTFTTVAPVYIVLRAVRYGLLKLTILRMVLN
jgi:hypothetical protein